MTFPDELSAEIAALIRTDEPLGPLLWLGIGGPAHYFSQPSTVDELKQVVSAANDAGLPVRVLGSGSNVLVRESGVDGLVISLASLPGQEPTVDGSTMTALAGTKLSTAVIESVGAGLGGLEHLIGIPGTIGGAVVGNVSAGGRDIGSVVHKVTVLEKDGSLRVLGAEEVGFSHRKSSLTGLIVYSVTFSLEPRDAAELTKRMQKLWISRNSTRPDEERRIAMPFIDPDSMPVRELIASVGLSGSREGEVSLDANRPSYMVAHPGATSDQCLKLIERVREQVLLQTGIDLQLNLQIW
ncbi:UDP-N-acetylenolpyruvoylglucosamine reductase MurB [Rubripirellula obstinata]|uniref:UDP-N-acetylenolpyruvoylglucosamine reductase n=1 Tax=Rubripirellula obstinata TaxID=406547 RepID=A0A5B1CQ14_9BACT|nr:FAD-binding protein [Rubripirellula obstinata]KAA1262331.1 UDP-N-acetylenolpyruvoylglucosamine reductase MurB [Rubripirellula obstinata]